MNKYLKKLILAKFSQDYKTLSSISIEIIWSDLKKYLLKMFHNS